MQQFWWTRGHLSEGRERLGALLAHPGGQERTKARADALNGAGILAYLQGDYGGARVLYEESLMIQRELDDKSGVANSLLNLGMVAKDEGDYIRARVLLEESLTIWHELGAKAVIAIGLEVFASVAMHEKDEERGACLWGAAAALRETIGSPLSPLDHEKQEREVTAVRETMGEHAFAAAWTRGRAMTMEQAIEHALSDIDVTSP